MIIISPRAMKCSLEPKEVEIIENCITLLKDMRDTMYEYDYLYLHVSDDSEITSGEMTDLIIKLTDLTHIDEMY